MLRKSVTDSMLNCSDDAWSAFAPTFAPSPVTRGHIPPPPPTYHIAKKLRIEIKPPTQFKADFSSVWNRKEEERWSTDIENFREQVMAVEKKKKTAKSSHPPPTGDIYSQEKRALEDKPEGEATAPKKKNKVDGDVKKKLPPKGRLKGYEWKDSSWKYVFDLSVDPNLSSSVSSRIKDLLKLRLCKADNSCLISENGLSLSDWPAMVQVPVNVSGPALKARHSQLKGTYTKGRGRGGVTRTRWFSYQ